MNNNHTGHIVSYVYLCPLFVSTLILIFTKDEIRHILHAFSEKIDEENSFLFLGGFKDIFPNMSTVTRSRLKKKLLENGIVTEIVGRIMINPEYIVYSGGITGIEKQKYTYKHKLENEKW